MGEGTLLRLKSRDASDALIGANDGVLDRGQ